MSEPTKYPDLDYHLQLLLDGQLGPEDLARLEAAILKDPGIRAYCTGYFITAAAVRRSSQGTGDLSGADLLASLRLGRTSRTRRPWRVYAAAAAIVMALSLFWILTHVASQPKGPVVGKLADQSRVLWQSPYRGLRTGADVHAGQSRLREGSACIELAQGARVVLQAPCAFSLDGANAMTLISGKLTAVVGPNARGFTVQTKGATLTDFGTAFGVIADAQGKVETHVFEGRVMVAPDSLASSQADSLLLDAGQAGAVDIAGQAARTASHAQPALFLRAMPQADELSCPGTRLNLADIVGGGNGFGTGTAGQGIDLSTGRTFQRPIRVVRQTQQTIYTPAADRRYIDGVFVPNARYGKVVISSTGLVFEDCPVTLGTYYEGVVNTAQQTAVDEPGVTYPGRFNGLEYGTPEHPGLNIHPNAGITFDLKTLRADNPGTVVERFTARCGISATVSRPRPSAADFWVLLDGQVVFHVSFPADQNRWRDVSVAVPANTRFLTLVTTCTGDAGYSWCFFGDPVLELTGAD